MSTPEAGARRTLARAIYADFASETAGFTAGGQTPDWLAWSHRLGIALSGLLDALDQADAATAARTAFHNAATASSGVAPDGTGRLSPPDVLTVTGALADAMVWATLLGRRNDVIAYRRLSYVLGDGG